MLASVSWFIYLWFLFLGDFFMFFILTVKDGSDDDDNDDDDYDCRR